MHFLVRHLLWSDLDPRLHAFDPQQAREAIASAVGQFTIHHALRPDRRADVAAAIDRALIAQVGAWSAGWSWSASEPGDGGPVPTSAYCCAEHSLVGSREDVTETALRAVSAWRARLEELAVIFDELTSVTEPTADAAVRAATRLLPQVVEWTNTDDAWYATFDAILRWALEHRGVDTADAARWVAASTKGHFASWCAPAPDALDAVSKTLRRETAQGETPPTNATDRWLKIREELGIRKRFYAPREVRSDGHLRLIETFDAIRDPMRAERMRQALACARAQGLGPRTGTGSRTKGPQERGSRTLGAERPAGEPFFAQLMRRDGSAPFRALVELHTSPIDGRTTASTSNARSTRGFRRTSPSHARGAFGRSRLSGVADYPRAFVIA